MIANGSNSARHPPSKLRTPEATVLRLNFASHVHDRGFRVQESFSPLLLLYRHLLPRR